MKIYAILELEEHHENWTFDILLATGNQGDKFISSLAEGEPVDVSLSRYRLANSLQQVKGPYPTAITGKTAVTVIDNLDSWFDQTVSICLAIYESPLRASIIFSSSKYENQYINPSYCYRQRPVIFLMKQTKLIQTGYKFYYNGEVMTLYISEQAGLGSYQNLDTLSESSGSSIQELYLMKTKLMSNVPTEGVNACDPLSLMANSSWCIYICMKSLPASRNTWLACVAHLARKCDVDAQFVRLLGTAEVLCARHGSTNHIILALTSTFNTTGAQPLSSFRRIGKHIPQHRDTIRRRNIDTWCDLSAALRKIFQQEWSVVENESEIRDSYNQLMDRWKNSELRCLEDPDNRVEYCQPLAVGIQADSELAWEIITDPE